MKNKLMKKEGNVIRILEEKDDKVFIIDCIKKTMPYWCNLAELSDFKICYEEFEVSREDLSAAEKRIMHERYTLIAGIGKGGKLFEYDFYLDIAFEIEGVPYSPNGFVATFDEDESIWINVMR